MSNDKDTLHDNAIGWLLLAVVAACLLWLIWYFFEWQLKDAYRTVRWAEMWVAEKVLPDTYTVKWFNPQTEEYQDIPVTKDVVDDVRNMPRQQLTTDNLVLITSVSITPWRWLFSGVLIMMGVWAATNGPGTQFRRKFDINGLIRVQAKNFPGIAPFINFNPSTVPPRPPGAPVPAELPPFAEALGPEEWIAYNEVPVPDGKVDEMVAAASFMKQLGPRWQGAQKLPKHKQVILAACCLKASRKRTESDDLLGRLAACWSAEKGVDFSKDKKLIADARSILKKRDLASSTIAKCNQHAFQTTAMLRALQNAREEGGVMAPAQFVWLRAYDRVLWYPLNNLGRQSFHAEALGAMAHFKAEKLAQRPIPRPKLEDALSTISEYMESGRARPIPQLDYSQSKKRGVKKPKAGVKKPKGKG